MAGVLSTPAQPPLPTTSSLPFQASVGSQTSISMCESGVGVSTAAIRQCAGTAGAAFTASDAVIVALGSETDFTPSHGPFDNAPINASAAIMATPRSA